MPAFVIFSPVIWWFCWWALGALRGVGDELVRGRTPDVHVGRQWQTNGATRQALREDGNARIFVDRGGILLRERRWFIASGTPPFEIDQDRWAEIADAQTSEPQYMAAFRDRTFWWYADSFYWTNADYTNREVKALLFARQRQQERELEHAHALLAASTSGALVLKPTTAA